MKFKIRTQKLIIVIVSLLIVSLTFSFTTETIIDTPKSTFRDTIRIDASKIINDTRRRQIGINTCIFTDDDSCYYRKPVRAYDQAIKEMGVKYLRYPGGYKSDIVFWSTPPYTKPNPTFVYSGSKVWPASDTTLVNKDGSWRVAMYDFDEFMATCKKTGAEPILVVTYNPLRWPVPPGAKQITKEQIIENARQWVRYANVVKKYHVKYWEIGNETWLDQKPPDTKTSQAMNQNDLGKLIVSDEWYIKIAPEVYGSDIPEIAKAMKQEDPSILIGANADSEEYCKGVLSKASQSVDFISAHSYPMGSAKSYNDYLAKDPDACRIIRESEKAMAAYPNYNNKDVKIMITEFASGAFGPWDREGTNLSKAIINFDIQGQFLQEPACYFTNFWNTINVYDKDNSVFNAMWQDNTLTSSGMAISIWGKYLEDEMVKTQSTKYVKCFATKTEGKVLTIFALNKDTLSHSAVLEIKNLKEHLISGELWMFRGTSLIDIKPSFLRKGEIRNLKDFTYELPPVSISMFRFQLRK